MTDLFNNDHSGAKFSKCGKHRLMLYRRWHYDKPMVAFIGLNPSTANTLTDDPTIRRVKKMAFSWGYGGVYMLNLFTFISTNPNLLNIAEGNSPDSNRILQTVASLSDKIIFAWGNFNVHGRDLEVINMFPNAYALHINRNGSPKHPLYVPGNVVPIPFNQI